MKKQIRNHVNELLFEMDVPDYLEDFWVDRYVVTKAITDNVNLRGAHLAEMNLQGVDFSSVDLLEANFSCSDLRGALFVGANCGIVDFSYANLSEANFSNANAESAIFDEATLENLITIDTCFLRATVKGAAELIGNRPIFQVGPLGVKGDYLVSLITNKGLRLKTKTFDGDFFEYEKRINANLKEGTTLYSEYQAAFSLIKSHEQTWTPVEYAKGSQQALPHLNRG